MYYHRISKRFICQSNFQNPSLMSRRTLRSASQKDPRKRITNNINEISMNKVNRKIINCQLEITSKNGEKSRIIYW